MAETLGVAIVGAGMMGAVHSRASRLAGATLKGIAASSPQSAKAAAAHLAHLGMERAYSNADEAIADPAVDVIHICTPNSTHYPIAMSALAAGKHVVCEKPLATSLSDARALAAAAQAAGRVAAVPFVYRYHPMVREARSLVQDGTVGALQLIHGSYLQDWLLGRDDTNWRVDAALGGPSRAFADIGSHWCDLIEWISGERFETVVATLQTIMHDRPTGTVGTFSSPAPGASLERQAVTTEDVAGALFRTTTGVLTTLTVSQVSAGRKNRLWFELDGARASLVFDQEEPERLWLGDRDSTRLLVRDPSRGSAEQRRLATLPAGHAQGYAQCFEAFVADTYAVIRGEAREGLPTFEDGYRSAQIIDAVLRSSKARAWEQI
ncbi:oxidoreductase domain-containing protein [Caballeronia udeis]|uniref:Oxidoreductase domain-containing protein n=1 Tax=Caballeronia udeis TaxID=1232866 RepID=A0A158FJA2_9BURK|nr:Gfo/Idh/MocA family oxidoreductase [Caballeronia udeis]SAL19934.1 oxidoreductase domain-containing protein [Caballeronia udeis]